MLGGISEIAGFAGVGISVIAYLPQIIHLIREHCSAGISPLAFCLWFIASTLVTFRAVVIADIVFVVLGIVQIITSLIILLYGLKYKDGTCSTHAKAYQKATD